MKPCSHFSYSSTSSRGQRWTCKTRPIEYQNG